MANREADYFGVLTFELKRRDDYTLPCESRTIVTIRDNGDPVLTAGTAGAPYVVARETVTELVRG